MAGPEEEVRKSVISELKKLGWVVEQMQWKPEWSVPAAPHDLTKRDRGQKFKSCGRADLALFSDDSRQPHALQVLFEMKEPTIDKGKMQLMRYLQSEPTCRMGVWTNGTSSITVYKSHTMDWVEVQNAPLPSPGDDMTAPPQSPPKWSDLQVPSEAQLRSTITRLLNVIVIEDKSVTRREQQLTEVIHVILTKIESDAVGMSKPDEPVSFRVYGDKNTMVKKTATMIRQQFKAYYTTHKNRIFISKHDTSSIKLTDSTIFKLVDSLAGWKILGTNVDLMSKALQILRVEAMKGGEGQYHTPYQIIKPCVKALQITSSDKVIDPACGSGGFVIEALNQVQENEFPDREDSWNLVKFANDKLYCIDRDYLSVKITRAMMVSLGDGSTHVLHGDSVRQHLWKKEYHKLASEIGSFDDGNFVDPSFTVVLTNPPFGKELKVSESDCRKSKYTISSAAAGVKAGNKDYVPLEIGLIFLEVAHRLLVEGGRLGIILPETYFFSHNYRWLPKWLEGRFAIRGVLNVPMPAFQEFCRAKTNFYIFEKVSQVKEEDE